MEFNIEYGGEVVDFDSIVRGAQAAGPRRDRRRGGVRQRPASRRGARTIPYYDVRLQVISRLPLIEAPGGSGLYLFVQVAPGEVVALSNVHLPAGPYSPNLVRRGAKRSTILEIERRVRVPAVEPSVTALTSLVDQGIPALLLGDFNTPSRLDWTPETVGLRDQIHYPVNWPTSRFVEESGFVDSYRVAHPDPVEDQGLTWPSGRPRPPGEWSPGRTPRPIGSTSSTRRARSRRSAATWSASRAGRTSRSRSIRGAPTIARSCPSSRWRAARSPCSSRSARDSSSRGPTRRSRSTDPAGPISTSWCSGEGDPSYPLADEPVPGVIDGTVDIETDGWEPGTYVVHLEEGAAVLSRTRFWVEAVGDGPHVSAERRIYGVGDPIHVRWWNAPGNRWDWVGVYERDADPNVASYLTWFYTRSTIQGPGNARRGVVRAVAAASRSLQRLPVGGRRVRHPGSDGVRGPLIVAVCG